MGREFVPQRLRAQYQWYIFFTFAIRVANQSRITVMATLLMRGHMCVGHQNV